MSGKKAIDLPAFLLIVLLVFLMSVCHSSMTSPFVDNATNTIVYCADRLDKNGVYIGGGVFVVRIDSPKVICLTDSLENERMPYCDFDWSSVRGQVVFATERADGARQIYSVNVDNSELVNLSSSDDCGFYSPSWSPNGESIAFVCHDGIYTMRSDGTNPRRLHDYYATTPYWSPDSTRIAFGAIEGGEYIIYVMNADGFDLHQITHSRVNSLYLDWSPDGTRIAFHGTNDNIIVANADGSGEMWLTDNLAVDEYPDWSPDGSQIVFAQFDN
jgi:Tol biopolymer transport system component